MNQINDLHEPKTIVLSRENYDKLKALGSMGDSFDQVISKVLTYVPSPKAHVKEIR